MGRQVAGVVCGVLFFAGASAFASDKQDEAQAPRFEAMELVHQDVSRPLREIKAIPPSYEWLERRQQPEPKKWRQPGEVRAPRIEGDDPALQRLVQPLVSATAGLSFDGVGKGLGTWSPSGAPPDTVGDVGATQYMQWVNTAFAIFNKSTGALVYGPANGNTLFSGFGGRCETDNSGDPTVNYDAAAGRWVVAQFAVSASPYYQCIAVSTTSDATGTWRRFAYSFGTAFNDYPKLGIWPDAYYITYNIFNNGSTWGGAKVCAYDRVNMLSASGTPGAQQCFQLSTTYGGLLPADWDGTNAPPAGAPNPVIAFDDINNNGLNMWKFSVNWTTPSSSTFTGPTKITTSAFTPACNGGTCIPQSGSTQQLDSLADRLMNRLQYRKFASYDSLVVSHAVTSGSSAGMRWYEIRNYNSSPTVAQQSTFAPDSTYRWMGSIAQDQQGNMLMGYSASSSSISPAIRITGRLATDAASTMQTETSVQTGGGSQGSGLSRWGDYAQMSVDPADDCTFWFTTEYLKSAGTFNWSTRVSSFKFPGCGGAPTPDFSVSASPASLTLNPAQSGNSTITVTSTNGFNSAVALSASGLPAGVSASFSPSSVTPPSNGSGTSTLTITNTSGASGTYNVTVTGTSGSTSRTASISLTIVAADQAAYDATLKAPKCATVNAVCDSGSSLLLGRSTKGPEPNQPNTINNSCADGTSGTFHSDESNDRIKVVSVDGTPFAAGKQVRIEATVWAYSSPASDKLDLYYAANANSPSWTFITTLTPSAGGAQTLTATYTLPTGSLQAVRANFRYNGTASSCSTGSYDDHDDLIFAVGAGSADTTAPTTSITSPTAGATVSGTTTISANASDNVAVSRVDFLVDGVVVGNDTTSPYSYAWATGSVSNGSHSLTTKAYDAAGNVGTSAAVSVTVNNVGPVTVFSDNAESATTTFVKANSTTTTQWTRTTSTPYAGSYSWKAGSSTGGNYGNSGNATLTTPTLNLSGATTASLSYAFKYSTEANYDFFKVRISTNGGSTWTNLVNVSGTSSGYSAWAPLGNINLNSYVGQTNVKVQFQFTTDGSVTGVGVFLDNVSITKQ